MVDNNKLPIPQKPSDYRNQMVFENYIKQLHDKIVEMNNRITALENP